MGAKIQIKNDSVKNFGGFYLFLDHFRKAGLDGIVDKTLGYRGVLAQYSYADIFSSLMAVYATGGTCVEDSARLSGEFSEKAQGYNFRSPDTILKMLGDFASEDTTVTSKDGKEYRFNINSRLNGMLLDGLIQCGQVNPQKKHIFDYDNQFIATEKKDARYSYKGAFVDKAVGKLKRVDDATIASMAMEPRLEMNYKDRRIILPKEGGEVLEPVRVLRADIDYNRHMNNANYVRVAMELLPEGFEVKGLRVEYRVAAKFGDVLVPTLYHIDGGLIVALSVGNETSAIIELT